LCITSKQVVHLTRGGDNKNRRGLSTCFFLSCLIVELNSFTGPSRPSILIFRQVLGLSASKLAKISTSELLSINSKSRLTKFIKRNKFLKFSSGTKFAWSFEVLLVNWAQTPPVPQLIPLDLIHSWKDFVEEQPLTLEVATKIFPGLAKRFVTGGNEIEALEYTKDSGFYREEYQRRYDQYLENHPLEDLIVFESVEDINIGLAHPFVDQHYRLYCNLIGQGDSVNSEAEKTVFKSFNILLQSLSADSSHEDSAGSSQEVAEFIAKVVSFCRLRPASLEAIAWRESLFDQEEEDQDPETVESVLAFLEAYLGMFRNFQVEH